MKIRNPGNKKFQPYQEGDQVWIEGTNLKTLYPSAKLAPKHYGPFKVMKQLSPAVYEIRIPTPMEGPQHVSCKFDNAIQRNGDTWAKIQLATTWSYWWGRGIRSGTNPWHETDGKRVQDALPSQVEGCNDLDLSFLFYNICCLPLCHNPSFITISCLISFTLLITRTRILGWRRPLRISFLLCHYLFVHYSLLGPVS